MTGPKTEDGPKFKKNFFSNFICFLEFGRTLENCTRRFR
jgi:hypothetical protein